jgi:hypothetical protein
MRGEPQARGASDVEGPPHRLEGRQQQLVTGDVEPDHPLTGKSGGRLRDAAVGLRIVMPQDADDETGVDGPALGPGPDSLAGCADHLVQRHAPPGVRRRAEAELQVSRPVGRGVLHRLGHDPAHGIG